MIFSKKNISRRRFLQYSLFPASTYLLSSSKSLSENFDTYMLKGPLAGNLYYTKERPGKWYNEVASHIPIVKKNSNLIEIITDHEMKGFEHYILKHVILDNQLKFISEKRFDPSKDAAFSKHDISGYISDIFILSICNVHDTWLSHIKL